jgi:hypothetical protein
MLSTFDPDKGPLFKGEFTHVDVIDPALPGHVPNLVINPANPFEIHVKWQITGTDVPLYLAALADNWSIEVFAESMGPGPEIRIAAGTVATGTPDTPILKAYEYTLTVPAGTLPEGNPGPGGPSGVYKLVCTCFLNSNLGPVGFDIAGFAEGPVIRVENPV